MRRARVLPGFRSVKCLPAAAEHLESVRPVPVEIDTRSPVRFEILAAGGNKRVKGVVLQVLPAQLTKHLLLSRSLFDRHGRLFPVVKLLTRVTATACVSTVKSA